MEIPKPVAAPSDVDEADEDNEEGEDDLFEEPFSLLDNVVRERFKTPAALEPYSALEVIHYQGREISDLMRADPGRKILVGPGRFCLASVRPGGRATLFLRSGLKGTLVRGGRRVCLGPGPGTVSLAEGDYAQVLHGSSGYLLRFVRPPAQPASRARKRINWGTVQCVAGSASFHALILVLLGFIAPEVDLALAQDDAPPRCRGPACYIPVLKHEKPSRPEPEKLVEARVATPAPARRPRKRPTRRFRRPEKKTAGASTGQVKGVLKALENIRPSGGGPARSNLGKLVSNIAAVRAPVGSGGYHVSSTIGKIKGGVKLASGGAGGVGTRTGSELLTGSQVGTLTGVTGVGTRPPRGRVMKPPLRDIFCDEGFLDRAAIQRVVNRHLHQVQRCYEKELLRNPGLSGKIVFDWTITRKGGVRTCRQHSSSMPSPRVASCVLGHIKRWRFPKPKGGTVRVRYPFVFRSRGF